MSEKVRHWEEVSIGNHRFPFPLEEDDKDHLRGEVEGPSHSRREAHRDSREHQPQKGFRDDKQLLQFVFR